MTVELTVLEMTCEGCERIVESALDDVDDVVDSEADHTSDTATVEGDPDVDELVRAVERAGYAARTEASG